MTSICAASTLTCSCVASVFFLVSSCFCSSFSASDRFDFVCEKKVKGVRQRQASKAKPIHAPTNGVRYANQTVARALCWVRGERMAECTRTNGGGEQRWAAAKQYAYLVQLVLKLGLQFVPLYVRELRPDWFNHLRREQNASPHGHKTASPPNQLLLERPVIHHVIEVIPR